MINLLFDCANDFPLYVDVQYSLENLQQCRYFKVKLYQQSLFLTFKIYENVL